MGAHLRPWLAALAGVGCFVAPALGWQVVKGWVPTGTGPAADSYVWFTEESYSVDYGTRRFYPDGKGYVVYYKVESDGSTSSPYFFTGVREYVHTNRWVQEGLNWVQAGPGETNLVIENVDYLEHVLPYTVFSGVLYWNTGRYWQVRFRPGREYHPNTEWTAKYSPAFSGGPVWTTAVGQLPPVIPNPPSEHGWVVFGECLPDTLPPNQTDAWIWNTETCAWEAVCSGPGVEGTYGHWMWSLEGGCEWIVEGYGERPSPFDGFEPPVWNGTNWIAGTNGVSPPWLYPSNVTPEDLWSELVATAATSSYSALLDIRSALLEGNAHLGAIRSNTAATASGVRGVSSEVGRVNTGLAGISGVLERIDGRLSGEAQPEADWDDAAATGGLDAGTAEVLGSMSNSLEQFYSVALSNDTRYYNYLENLVPWVSNFGGGVASYSMSGTVTWAGKPMAFGVDWSSQADLLTFWRQLVAWGLYAAAGFIIFRAFVLAN